MRFEITVVSESAYVMSIDKVFEEDLSLIQGVIDSVGIVKRSILKWRIKMKDLSLWFMFI